MTAPSRASPSHARGHSTRFGSMIATRSPCPTPLPASAAATRSTRASSAANVRRSPVSSNTSATRSGQRAAARRSALRRSSTASAGVSRAVSREIAAALPRSASSPGAWRSGPSNMTVRSRIRWSGALPAGTRSPATARVPIRARSARRCPGPAWSRPPLWLPQRPVSVFRPGLRPLRRTPESCANDCPSTGTPPSVSRPSASGSPGRFRQRPRKD